MDKQYYVYIMTNERHSVLYTGVTNNLMRRVSEHKEKIIEGFTRKYNVTKLVYYEIYNEPYPAIQREKSIKGISRERKITLIKSMNPSWNDLMAMFE
ncbi:MAG TPA: GIY-YIG nuclease family protein [Candidatus Kapabacteria bacterium]|nr:GIY-YIG nuclease family protein [Candidatus Kapabacteria bacterium]